MSLILQRLAARKMVQVLGNDTTGLNGAKLRLLSGAVVISPGVKWADLTEASFDGYGASETLTWSGGVIDAAGNGQVTAPSITFAASDTITVGDTITGLAYTQGSSTITLVAAEALASPVGVNVAGDFVRVDPVFSLPAPATTPVQGPNGEVQ